MTEPKTLTVTYEVALEAGKYWADLIDDGTVDPDVHEPWIRAQAAAYRKWEQENQPYYVEPSPKHGKGTWCVRERCQGGLLMAYFFGPTAEADARNHADWKNAQEAGE